MSSFLLFVYNNSLNFPFPKQKKKKTKNKKKNIYERDGSGQKLHTESALYAVSRLITSLIMHLIKNMIYLMHVRISVASITRESFSNAYPHIFMAIALHRKIVAYVSRKYRSNRNKISHAIEWLQTECVARK